ncbi:MAG: FHA domain-containing protein [Gemmataceae bacterium]
MTLRWFLYYCAAWGAVAGLLGWAMSVAVVFDNRVVQEAVKGLLLGLSLAVILVLVDVAFTGFRWTSALAVAAGGFVGGLGGFVGGMIGQLVYGLTDWDVSLVFGWTLTGLLIGASPGMFDLLARLARNEEAGGATGKVINGLIGGAVGGLLGGGFFLALKYGWGMVLGTGAVGLWSPTATGFVVLGACIGLLVGLAQVILKEAWIKVEAGFRAGRELILTRPEITVGRGEGCDIALFGDPSVDKLHARIVAQGGRYFVEDAGSVQGTAVNGRPVSGRAALRDGDRIEVGRATLVFGERAKRE